MRVYARVRVSMRGNVHAYAWICTRKQNDRTQKSLVYSTIPLTRCLLAFKMHKVGSASRYFPALSASSRSLSNASLSRLPQNSCQISSSAKLPCIKPVIFFAFRVGSRRPKLPIFIFSAVGVLPISGAYFCIRGCFSFTSLNGILKYTFKAIISCSRVHRSLLAIKTIAIISLLPLSLRRYLERFVQQTIPLHANDE